MRADTVFDGDDLRRTDPKFLAPRFAQYLAAVGKLDRLAQRFGKRVIHVAVRWMLCLMILLIRLSKPLDRTTVPVRTEN